MRIASSQCNDRLYCDAGITVVYDLTKPNEQRSTEVRIRCTHCNVPRYDPLHPNTTYTILTSTFILNGGDGYGMVAANGRNVVPYGKRPVTVIILQCRAWIGTMVNKYYSIKCLTNTCRPVLFHYSLESQKNACV